MTKGTEGAHMFERAFTSNEAQVQTIFAQARARIADRMAGGSMSLDDIRGAIVTRLTVFRIVSFTRFSAIRLHNLIFGDFTRPMAKCLAGLCIEFRALSEWILIAGNWPHTVGALRHDEPDDAAETEIAFDRLIEAARSAFRHDETLGGVVETIMSDGQAGLQLDDLVLPCLPAFFATMPV